MFVYNIAFSYIYYEIFPIKWVKEQIVLFIIMFPKLLLTIITNCNQQTLSQTLDKKTVFISSVCGCTLSYEH